MKLSYSVSTEILAYLPASRFNGLTETDVLLRNLDHTLLVSSRPPFPRSVDPALFLRIVRNSDFHEPKTHYDFGNRIISFGLNLSGPSLEGYFSYFDWALKLIGPKLLTVTQRDSQGMLLTTYLIQIFKKPNLERVKLFYRFALEDYLQKDGELLLVKLSTEIWNLNAQEEKKKSILLTALDYLIDEGLPNEGKIARSADEDLRLNYLVFASSAYSAASSVREWAKVAKFLQEWMKNLTEGM